MSETCEPQLLAQAIEEARATGMVSLIHLVTAAEAGLCVRTFQQDVMAAAAADEEE